MSPSVQDAYKLHLRGPASKYLFALAMVAVAILLRFALEPLIGFGYQYVTVFPFIMVVAIYAGRGPAILHAILAGLLATYYFSAGYSVGALLSTLIVIFTGFLAGGLAQRLHQVLAQAHQRSAELAESEQKFRMLADNAQAVIGIVQGEHFIYINPYIEKLSGYTPDEILHIGLEPLIHPDDRQTVLERARRRQAGEPVETHYEFRMLTKSGRIRWLDFSPVLITYRGKPAIVGIALDITARKHAEDELRRTHGLLQSITQGTYDMIAAIDDDFRFLFFNDAYQWEYKKFWGRDVQVGDNLLAGLGPWPAQQEKIETLWNRALLGESFSVITDFGPSDENLRTYDIRFNPIYDDRGRNIGAAHILRDITEQVRIQKQLAESESFYRQTLDSIPGMVFTTRPDGYCDYQSRQWVEFTGVPMEQMLGDGWNKLVHPDDRPRVLAAWRQAFDEKIPYDLEYRIRRFNGQYEWFKVRGRPIRDAAGNIVRWLGIAANVSDLKQAQEALVQSEARFRGTFENAGVGITIVGLDSNWIDVNRRFCEMTGYSKQALVGASFPIITHPDDLDEDLRLFAQLRTGEVQSYFVEKRYVTRDGRIRWVDLYRALQRDENNRPLYTTAVVIDVTDRKRAEEDLRRSEARFRGTFENAAVGITLVDLDGNWIDLNRRFADMVGYTSESIKGTNFAAMTYPEDLDNDQLQFAQLRQGGIEQYAIEKRYVRKDGNLIWVELYRALQRDDSGKPMYAISVDLDITDRKKAEEALRQNESDLRRYKDQLENKNKEMESIIGIVSHDLRAPLVNIQGFSGEIKMDCQTLDNTLTQVPVEQEIEKQLEKILRHNIPESLHYIQTSTEAMNNLVRTLVEVARAGLAPTRPEVIDMSELMAKIIENLKMKFKEANVVYDVIVPLPDCFADRTQVTQIVTNLLDNAVKYLDSSRNGQICVGGTPQAGGVLYWVSDNGIGIAPDQQEKIFEPYYQLREKASGGIGMGLATVRKLIDRNNGKVWLVSEKDKYSIFYVALPAPPSDANT